MVRVKIYTCTAYGIESIAMLDHKYHNFWKLFLHTHVKNDISTFQVNRYNSC